MKIAIYGGTYDPVTSAHLEIIKRLSEKFDKVIVVPTTIRYYKKNKQMFSFSERFEALKEKCYSFKNVEVSDIERNVNDEWRFCDTLAEIVANTENAEFYVAMGSDSFQKFTSWCNYEEILEKAKLIVFRRPGYEDNFPNIPHEYIGDMDMKVSSTAIRNKLREYIDDMDFDEMIDDLSFIKGFEDYTDYHY